jgi:hypothetical protein
MKRGHISFILLVLVTYISSHTAELFAHADFPVSFHLLLFLPLNQGFSVFISLQVGSLLDPEVFFHIQPLALYRRIEVSLVDAVLDIAVS